jgi:hypothetical protein
LEKASARRIHGFVDRVEVQKREVSKTEDPKSQTHKHTQPDQPIKPLFKDVSQAGKTISKDSRMLDLPLYLALLDDSLRFCKQPVTCVEKVDDTHWRVRWDRVQIRLVTDG